LVKRRIKFDEIKLFILSPGNIFWKKNSGAEILITKKGDMCNFEVMKKIDLNSQKHGELLIENEIDIDFVIAAKEMIQLYNNESSFDEKLNLRSKLVSFLIEEFIHKKRSQFEFVIVCVSWFVGSNVELMQNLVSKDKDIFIQAINYSSCLAVSSFLTGYYDTHYLAAIFSDSISYFKELLEKESAYLLKESLKRVRRSREHLKLFEAKGNIVAEVLNSRLEDDTYASDLEKLIHELDWIEAMDINSNSNFLLQVLNTDLGINCEVLGFLKRTIEKIEEAKAA
jgi:hypothetical protein